MIISAISYGIRVHSGEGEGVGGVDRVGGVGGRISGVGERIFGVRGRVEMCSVAGGFLRRRLTLAVPRRQTATKRVESFIRAARKPLRASLVVGDIVVVAGGG